MSNLSSTPKVSVLTPIYNTNPQHLRECIESILAQTFTDFEFIILNDSPDNKEVEKIVKSYKDKRIKYYKNKENIGISNSRNKLIDLSKGEYLAIFDHDDISLPERLQKEVEILDKHKEIGAVSGWVLEFIDNSNKYKIKKLPNGNTDINTNLSAGKSANSHTASMLRKSVLIDNNIRYESQFSPCEDFMLFLKLIPYTHFYNIQDVIVKYRLHPNNTVKTQSNKLINTHMLCLNYSQKEYPYLFMIAQKQSTHWIKLFNFIPLLRIKSRDTRKTYYLFGFIPIIRCSIAKNSLYF